MWPWEIFTFMNFSFVVAKIGIIVTTLQETVMSSTDNGAKYPSRGCPVNGNCCHQKVEQC